MKRNLFFLISALLISGMIQAQQLEDWKSSLDKIKTLIQSNSVQADGEVGELLKGKNKKNVDLLTAVSYAYLNAGKLADAQKYLDLAKKADKKNPAVSVLEGDIALVQKDAGRACQLYEQAIYFDPNYKEAYLKYAQVYKAANPTLAIDKLEQLKTIDPNSLEADKALADIYYSTNKFSKACEMYANFINTSQATDDDRLKYAFALFMSHQFDKSLEVVQSGLKNNPRRAAFNRLAMYNYTDLKRYEEAEKAADAFFKQSDNADYSALDYQYHGFVLMGLKKYDIAVDAFKKAIDKDSTLTSLWQQISDAYENLGKYSEAIDAYKAYYNSLKTEDQTPDLLFQLGRMYYSEATADTLNIAQGDKDTALHLADSIFAQVTVKAPESYLGNLWRARTNSILDPETVKGLAKPYYEAALSTILAANNPKYNSLLIECYSYLGYYYIVANEVSKSKEYWNKILGLDPNNATAKKALGEIK